MKRILVIILIILAGCTTDNLVGEAVELQASSVNVSPGDIVTLEVWVTNEVDVGGAQFDIIYDSNLFTYLDITEGPFLSSDGANTFFPTSTINTATPGVISDIIIARLETPGITGSGVLFTIRFYADNEGSATFAINNLILADSQARAINTTTGGTVVTVKTTPPPDTTPPQVTMVEPSTGATVSGTIPITATATDDVGVIDVQLLLNGANLGPPMTEGSYNWDTTTVADANDYTIQARARDAAGNIGLSQIISVNVRNRIVDTTPPQVTITSPPSGEVKNTITVAATATDNVRVDQLQFYLDGTPLGQPFFTDTASFEWDSRTLAEGTTHTLSVIATDSAGLTASNSILISTWVKGSGGGGSGKGGGASDPQCADGQDNDDDGTCDFSGCTLGKGRNRYTVPADPDCVSEADDSE